MNLRILSDLHFEFHRDGGRSFIAGLEVDPDEVLVLAGDIATALGLATALAAFCARFRHVLFVPGNHEYYHRSPAEVRAILETAASKHPNLHWLDNRAVILDGQRFIGGTLWFDEDAGTLPGRMMLSDFGVIDDFEPWVYRDHEACVRVLERELRADDVVITHHLPSQACVHPRWANSILNAFFVHDMEPLILKRQPKLWLHGHTHEPVDVRVGATRIVANPFGYLGHEERGGFVERLVLAV